jgi:hypothetical protein
MILFAKQELPDGFNYPVQFLRLIANGLVNLEPWKILEGVELNFKLEGLTKRFPLRRIVPFAARIDCDDVACFDISESCISIIHDFAGPGFEQNGRFADFNAWLRATLEDYIEFGEG